MKLTIKYEFEEIKALIREDLVRQGITAAADAPIEFDGNLAVIEVQAARDGTLLGAPLPAPVTPPPLLVQEKVAAAPPPLEVVTGGAHPVDMTDILGVSSRLAQTEQGKYPPRERELMEGESYEYPHK